MLLVIVSGFIYAICSFLSSFMLLNLPVVVVLGLIYGMPLILSIVTVVVQKTNKYKLLVTFIHPILSVVFYGAFMFAAIRSGAWETFVRMQTIESNHVTLNITQTPLDSSQIMFIVIMFFSVSLGTYVVTRKTKDNAQRRLTCLR